MAMHVCVNALVIIRDDHTVLFNLVSKHPKNIRLGDVCTPLCVSTFLCACVSGGPSVHVNVINFNKSK